MINCINLIALLKKMFKSEKFTHVSEFKINHPFEKRIEVCSKILLKYPDRIPTIVEKANKSTDNIILRKKKFIVPRDITMGKFIVELRKHMSDLLPEESIFLFIQDALIPTTQNFDQIYNKYKDEDGFLYIILAGENTFGCN